ncbi:hypothetical protein BK816_02330 [Boudabousia tangfeifanii]|uniref:Hydrolase of the HAD superfamily n=1 Tax=Boudabousia tangfeifanii TaxID=1912795 RepID=A0A1D9MJC4_9ACTO|nr:HAD family phosphatase [Boudabousia tangfeifanii]AOZ72280.1 hypothetical protein BK816_02330 [Boudabousia tangfeifanii]
MCAPSPIFGLIRLGRKLLKANLIVKFRVMKAVVFDMYGVLYRHAAPEVMHWIIGQSGAYIQGVSAQQFLTAWAHDRHSIDAGLVSLEDYWAQMNELCNVDFDWKTFIDLEAKYFGSTDHEMLDFAREIKARGYRIGILSNIPEYMNRAVYDHLEWFSEFDVVIRSCEHGLAKPDLEIYQLTAQQLGIEPQNILFLDDNEANITGAKKAGMIAHLHHDLEETRRIVDDFLAD